MKAQPIPYPDLEAIQHALRQGKTTCRTLVEHYLHNIEVCRDLNAYVEVFADEALNRADAMDQGGTQAMGKLRGAIISIKDVISFEGHGLTAGSKILEGYKASFSATVVDRLLAEDAIIIGRVNCDEFAMGSDNQTSVYGPVRNGLDPTRVPGGSSGGSAVAVQTHQCLVSVGSDTGGSVRQPASFCGVTGFKPSYGRISRHGLIAYGSSFDQIGFIAHQLEDIRKVYEVVHGPDHYDGTLAFLPEEHQVASAPPEAKGTLRFAILGEALTHEGLQPAVKARFEERMQKLRDQGHHVDTLSFDLLDYVIPAYYVLTSAEASSNLSRYDGIRYGYRSQQAGDLAGMYTQTRTQGFGDEVKRRILLGTFVLSVGYYDAYFAKAQKVRRLIKERFDEWLTDYDGILIPTAPTTAWRMDERKSPVEIYLADIFSVLANLCGLPALSIPIGFDDQNLPVGMQILAARFKEENLFHLAQEVYH